MTNPFEKKQLRDPYSILRDIANQGGKKDRPEGSEKTLVPWDLIEEAREFCGPYWRYDSVDHHGRRLVDHQGKRLTTHPKPEPNPDRPLPPGKTCEDCTGFLMCRSLRNISGFTTCTANQRGFKPKRRGYY